MDIDTINWWVEHPIRDASEEIENRFFDPIRNRIPEPITYNQLRQINIPEDPPATLDDLVEEFGIEIPDEDAEKITTVQAAVDYLDSNK